MADDIMVAAPTETVSNNDTSHSRHRVGKIARGRHRSMRPRTLHVIDLENLVAGQVTEDNVRLAWAEYKRVLDVRWDDHVIVGVAKKNAFVTFHALPGTVQRVVGENMPNGADDALVEATDIRWAVTRFQQVVVASGDERFVGLAKEFGEAGLSLLQVIGGGLTSTELYLNCPQQIHLRDMQRRLAKPMAAAATR